MQLLNLSLTHAVPKVPNITALARVSGTGAILTWQSYTLDTSKGFLTKVEVAYQSVPVTTTTCPTITDVSGAKVIRVDPPDETMYNFADLQAEQEYCVAVRAWTATGSRGYSDALRLPCKSAYTIGMSLYISTCTLFLFLVVSESSLFQIRFQLPEGVVCRDFIVSYNILQFEFLSCN